MIKWTEASLTEEAAKYSCRSDFLKGSSGACDAAYRRFPGLIENLFPSSVKRWDKDSLIKEAGRYETRTDFIRESRSAYFTMIARFPGLVDELFTNGFKKWDLSSVIDEAVKYRTRSEFQLKANGAYLWARRNSKAIIEIFFTYSDGTKNIDSVYIWCADSSEGIYKVGITSSTRGDQRIKRVVTDGEFEVCDVLAVVKVGRQFARDVESVLKNTGVPVMFDRKFDGYTEFRKMTSVEVDSCVTMLKMVGCAA